MRHLASAVVLVGAVALTAGCGGRDAPLPPPALVLESDSGKSEPVELIVLDLSGRELLRRSTGTTGQALSSLHSASAQVAFWRTGASGSGHELVVWSIATNVLKVLGTYDGSLVSSPLWSRDGTEVVSLVTSTPISYMPGATFDGKASISITTVATGRSRVLPTDRVFLPAFADGKVVSGGSLSGDMRFIAVDAQSGQLLRELRLAGAVGSLPTADPDVIVSFRETAVPGEVTLHALNAKTGSELSRLGSGFAGPMVMWPGRTEVAFVSAGDLKAYDYAKNATRVVGRLENVVAALGFDPPGKTLLAWVPTEPFYGTFTVEGDRLTSAFKMIPRDPSMSGIALGLVRVKLS